MIKPEAAKERGSGQGRLLTSRRHPEARGQEWLSARDRATLFEAVGRRLSDEPAVENRNRKRLRPNPIAPWELRIGRLPVYFDVEESPRRVVTIQAVGVRDRNRLFIGGEEVELR